MEASVLISGTLKVSVSLLITWGLWFTFLRNVNRFSMVRGFILLGVLLSITTPWILPLLQSKAIVSFNSLSNNLAIESNFLIPEIILGAHPSSGISWQYFLTSVYLIISGLFAIKLLFQLYRIFRISKCGQKVNRDGLLIVEHSENISPFSFMNYCFINTSLVPNNKLDDILIHEKAHFNKMHSADILLFELIGIFQWFNPFYWLLRKALVELHEYQADSTAILSKSDPYAYLDTIVTIAFQGVALPIGNNFNKSLTLKRLAMMNISKKSRLSILRLAFALALAIPIIVAVSCDNSAQQFSTLNEEEEIKSSLLTSEIEYDGSVFVVVEEMPGFNGGKSDLFREYIAENLTYPKEASEKGIQGRVFVNFIVEKDGTVTNVKIVRGVDPLLDQEAIRVVESSPKWISGKQGGETVRTTFTFPITFILSN